METIGAGVDTANSDTVSSTSNSFPIVRFLQAPVTTLFEYSGVLRPRPSNDYRESEGFFVTIYVTAFMYKSNDILRKQTALKGERKLSVLVGYSIIFMLHVVGVYWWYQSDDLSYPLFMVPPKTIPPFWHAIFIIIIQWSGKQQCPAFKLVLLMYYRNGRGHNFRRQGQMLTLVEYGLLLYRAFLPAPVWYRFFLNKEYGGLFSSLITGLYLTFKLTSLVEKVYN
ncbi:hypothetical protein Tco_0922933 [Tanacetum coccineum]|uniref:Uncharacterized protein n=1 Tax=Tanacetum coccineum TaxID=301880 RepID=A0ABQ5D6P9_9ASTR